jgi:hypothetical protein
VGILRPIGKSHAAIIQTRAEECRQKVLWMLLQC